ncbi:MAG: hypothetical protein AABY22_13465, partial [Nanoarchaeota archaeon]
SNMGRVLAFTGALAVSLLSNGCRTIELIEREYGKAIAKNQVVGEREEIEYYFSELNRDSDSLDVNVNKQGAKIQEVKLYDVVPVTEVKYHAVRRANARGFFVGGILGYPLANVGLVGFPLLYDSVMILTFQPEETMLNGSMLGEQPMWGPGTWQKFSYDDKSSKREISRREVENEERNTRTEKNRNIIFDIPAKQIDVKLNDETIKKTNDNGYVSFEIPQNYEGEMVIETLAKDGINDREEIR